MPCACLERGRGLPHGQKCYPPAFNAPANISLRSCWDVNAYASFLYWHVNQEGMETAVQLPVDDEPGTFTKAGSEYHPGFKVGLGVNLDYDDWTSFLEYTWMHQNTNNSSTTTAPASFIPNNWAVPDSPNGLLHLSVSSKWKMNLDQLDLALSRPFYQGERLTIAPFGGLRALWIRQNLNIVLDANEYKARSNSWAVGPMLGALTNWLLDCGFRMEGKAGASLLYTRYTRIRQNQITNGTSASSRIRNWDSLRPTANLGVGLGWGTYTGCKDYHFDLSARYDFHILWSQNVMAKFVNAMNGIPGTAADLYLHGLTLTMRLDF